MSYYFNGNSVFYKDNFIYDWQVIKEGLDFLDEIAFNIAVNEFEIYFGQILERDFALDFYYGKYSNGIIIRDDTIDSTHHLIKHKAKYII